MRVVYAYGNRQVYGLHPLRSAFTAQHCRGAILHGGGAHYPKATQPSLIQTTHRAKGFV